jgi:hypothetical protein
MREYYGLYKKNNHSKYNSYFKEFHIIETSLSPISVKTFTQQSNT